MEKYRLLEEKAHSLFSQGKFEEAYKLFKEVANFYKAQGNHKQAALSFASAASCWGIRSGEKTFYESARLYEEAAREAERYLDFEYASTLYKHAAINYERDGELLNFSESFYNSKESYRKFLAHSLKKSKKIYHIKKGEKIKGVKSALKEIILWFLFTFSYLIWGYGERPSRTLYAGIMVIFLSPFLYTCGLLFKNGLAFKPNFLESLYFSLVTFTTVGYGDITPIGFSKIVAVLEGFSGMFIIPLFIVGLSRRYLRI